VRQRSAALALRTAPWTPTAQAAHNVCSSPHPVSLLHCTGHGGPPHRALPGRKLPPSLSPRGQVRPAALICA
jgi:hypothetical protein